MTTGASLNTPPLTLCREGRIQHFMAAMATQPVLDGSAESFAAIVSLPGNAKGCSLRSLLVVKPPDSKAAVPPSAAVRGCQQILFLFQEVCELPLSFRASAPPCLRRGVSGPQHRAARSALLSRKENLGRSCLCTLCDFRGVACARLRHAVNCCSEKLRID